jgi:hypothetical protein
MAVSPLSLHKLSPEDQKALVEIEKIIDSKLQANFDLGGSIRLNVSAISDSIKARLTSKMQRDLAEMYRKVNWNVDVEATPTTVFFTFSEAVAEAKASDPVPSDMPTQEMLDKMSEARTSAPSGPVSSPFKPMPIPSRDDPEGPYKRAKLNSKA